MPIEKRKHGDLSSVSDLETSVNSPVGKSTPDSDHSSKTKAQRKKDLKKARTENEKEETKTADSSKESQTGEKMATESGIQEEITQINKKLNQILTKDNNSFLKQLIKDVFQEIKDTLFESLTKKIEVIEGDIHDKAVENNNLKTEIEKLKKQVEEKHETIQRLENKHEQEKENMSERFNAQEQYSRKNNVIISSLPEDTPKQNAAETTGKVLNFFQEKLGVIVSPGDIDISHRLGQYKTPEQPRSVIVKFVRRQTKIDVLSSRKKLKGTKIYINEDLTRLNNEVLASARKKQPEEVEQAWSMDGNIFIKWKADSSTERLKFSDYQKWIELPWHRQNNKPEDDRCNTVSFRRHQH